jgi:large subunit ribosomal protein L35
VSSIALNYTFSKGGKQVGLNALWAKIRKRPADLTSFPRFSSGRFSVKYGATPNAGLSTCEINVMPKQKTHKGTKKRFRLTATGKVKHRSAGTSHLSARKSQKRVRQLRGTTVSAESGIAKNVIKALAGNSY